MKPKRAFHFASLLSYLSRRLNSCLKTCYTVGPPPTRGAPKVYRRARKSNVAEEKPKVTNEISDETGQHDARFLLWRRFCSDNGIPVETMPGDLSGEAKQKWEKLKANLLPKSMNK